LLTGALLTASPAFAAGSSADYAPLPPPPAVDPSAVPMPDINFTPTPDDEKGFDKYFFFHREQTDFATAYADIRECDQYTRGRPLTAPYNPNSVVSAMQNQMVSQYGLAGAAGGAVGGIIGGIIAAEMAAAEMRKMRRKTLLTCMGFKQYRTFGLSKDKWQLFNFAEGGAPKQEDQRQYFLQMQAKVASGPKPTAGEVR
jgi:hypothetical protein